MEWQISSWSPWDEAVTAYTGIGSGAGDDKYMEKFRRNYQEITAAQSVSPSGSVK